MEKIRIDNFQDHNADVFQVEKIVDFMKDQAVCYRDWSSSIECDLCYSKGVEYFRENVKYIADTSNQPSFFNIAKDDEEPDDEDVYDFTIYYCPQCDKWWSYIE